MLPDTQPKLHEWRIESREYARHEARRGRRFAYTSLVPARTALVVVADANAARRDEDHNATLHTVYRSFGDVRPTSEVLGLIGG